VIVLSQTPAYTAYYIDPQKDGQVEFTLLALPLNQTTTLTW